MAFSDDDNKWQTCETSRRRDFVYRPNSSTPIFRPQTSKAYRNSYALSDPVGETAYSEDFYWKPPSKPECIRTGTASGNRRNNPHPSQAFMVLKLPPEVKSWGKLPTAAEVRNAVSAQYKSTYRTDFLGLPQGALAGCEGAIDSALIQWGRYQVAMVDWDHNPIASVHVAYNFTQHAELSGRMLNHTVLSSLKGGNDVHHVLRTEMSSNYRKPIQNADLRGNVSRYGCNALHGVAPRGIVPTVVPKHISNQESRKHLTTYDQYFGGKSTDPSSVFSSLQPQDLRSFYKHLSEKEKTMVQSILQSSPNLSGQRKKVKNSVKFSPAPPTLERTSAWPGPL